MEKNGILMVLGKEYFEGVGARTARYPRYTHGEGQRRKRLRND